MLDICIRTKKIQDKGINAAVVIHRKIQDLDNRSYVNKNVQKSKLNHSRTESFLCKEIQIS